MSKGKKEENFQIELNNQENWEDLMQRDGLKVIDIYQEWSGPCQATRNIFKQINSELNDPMLFFATANVDKIDSLEKYRGRTEPYFLFYGGSVLVSVVKGANCPELNSITRSMLKQEHEVLAGDLARVEVDDLFLKQFLEEKVAEEKRKSLQREINQETATLIILPALVGTEVADYITDMIHANGFEIVRDEIINFDDAEQDLILDDEREDPDFTQRLNLFSSAPSRCLLITKGSQGVVSDLNHLVGPKQEESEDKNVPSEENETNIEEEILISIRDKFGGSEPKSCVKLLRSVEENEALQQVIFPDFEAPKVVIYMKEKVAEENLDEINVDPDFKDSEAEQESDESSGLPDYVGLPRVVVVARPSAYATYGAQIVAKLVEWQYEVINTKEYTFTEEEAQVYYAEYKNMSIFSNIMAEVTSRPSFVIVACKENAYKNFKDQLGPESFSRASEDPTTLRGLFSSIPDLPKSDDMTWVDGTINIQDAAKLINYFFPVEDTLAALKPESIPVRDEMLEKIKETGFKIVAKKEETLTVADAKIFYENCKNKSYFEDLIKNITSGPILFMILRASDAVKQWHKLIGPTDPDMAVDMYPMDVKPESVCVRGIYGRTALENAIHGSSSLEEAKKNIAFIFGDNFYTKERDETDDEEDEDEEEEEEDIDADENEDEEEFIEEVEAGAKDDAKNDADAKTKDDAKAEAKDDAMDGEQTPEPITPTDEVPESESIPYDDPAQKPPKKNKK